MRNFLSVTDTVAVNRYTYGTLFLLFWFSESNIYCSCCSIKVVYAVKVRHAEDADLSVTDAYAKRDYLIASDYRLNCADDVLSISLESLQICRDNRFTSESETVNVFIIVYCKN